MAKVAQQLGDLISTQSPYGEMAKVGKEGDEKKSKPKPKIAVVPGTKPSTKPAPEEELGAEETEILGEVMKLAEQTLGRGSVVEFDGPARAYHSPPPTTLSEQDLKKLRDNAPDGLWWVFQGKERFVSKAVRIPYTYERDGEEHTEYLLIGYEGAGW